MKVYKKTDKKSLFWHKNLVDGILAVEKRTVHSLESFFVDVECDGSFWLGLGRVLEAVDVETGYETVALVERLSSSHDYISDWPLEVFVDCSWRAGVL